MEPNLTDVVSNFDTTRIAPGPHSEIKGLTPIFDVDRENLGVDEKSDQSLEDRFTKKAVAAGTQEYQDSYEGVAAVDEPERLATVGQVESTDTSGLDANASSAGVSSSDEVGEANTEGAAKYGNPDGVGAKAGPKSSADAFDEDDEDDEVEDYDADSERKAFEKAKVGQVTELADTEEVEYPEGALKADIIDALVDAQVSSSEIPPEDA